LIVPSEKLLGGILKYLLLVWKPRKFGGGTKLFST